VFGKRDSARPEYLEPYRRAVEQGGAEFESLLGQSKTGQETRFRVMREMLDMTGRVVADLGCGRADFAAHLHHAGVEYGRYVGVEGIADLLGFCRDRAKNEPLPECVWVEGDFVGDKKLFETLVRSHGVEVLTFSGSLNTLDQPDAIAVLERAWESLGSVRGGTLVFNFLSDRFPGAEGEAPGPGKRFNTPAMLGWALGLAESVAFRQDYMGAHDATIVMRVE